MLLRAQSYQLLFLSIIFLAAFILPVRAHAQLYVPVATGLDDGID